MNSDNDGGLGISDYVLAAISTALVAAYKNRDLELVGRNIYSLYDSWDKPNAQTLMTRIEGSNLLPAIMPQEIPSMDTVIDLPLSWESPDFTLREYLGKQQSGDYPGYFDDKYDFKIGSMRVGEGSHVSLISTAVGIVDLAIPSLTVPNGASISTGHNVQFGGDG